MVEYMEGTDRRCAEGPEEVSGAGASRSATGLRRTRADRVRAYERMSADPLFVELRRRFALRAGALVLVFLTGYLSYLLLSAHARDFMGTPITDSVNVALVMGIGQFLLTFVLAWAFGRSAERSLDPLARRIRGQAREEEAADGTAVLR